MFIVQSGEIKEIINNIIDENNLSSGELAIENTFLNLYKGNASDFIISWEDVNLNINHKNGQKLINEKIINKGKINFSKLERENEELKKTMKYARTILAIMFYLALANNYWKVLLMTLRNWRSNI